MKTTSNSPNKFLKSGKTRPVVKETEGNSILSRITSPYREWHSLPAEIHARFEKSQRNLGILNEILIDYRLELMKANYMDKKFNHEIWYEFLQAKVSNENLGELTLKKSLRMRRLKTLRKLNSDWQNLILQQNKLLDVIFQAPGSLKFYNLKMTYAELKKQQILHDEYNESQFAKAHSAVDSALEYVDEYVNKLEKVSRILSFPEIRKIWIDKLSELTELYKSGRTNPEELLKKMDALKNAIFEAPPMAKWIDVVEERYSHLINDHDLLQQMYKKTVIHSEELEETNNIIYDVIPRLWLNGENLSLDRYIKQIETFLNLYEPALQEELAYQERHRPWSSDGNVQKDADELDMLISFVQIMTNAIEARESHMGDHSKTVARLAKLTSEELGWSEQEIKYLQIAGLLHDIGKIWIPETLLTKSGPLTDNEMQILRMHPFYSAKIVESINALKNIVPWVYHHHERWDGKGYPDGLSRDEIPLGASIIAVAEAFSAMIFNRLSRQPLTFDQAIKEIRDGSGKQFDPDVTEQFITAATKIQAELEEMQKKGFSSLLI